MSSVENLFRASVLGHSGDDAVRGPSGRISYRELDDRSDRIAAALLRYGAPNRRVGIALERDIDYVVGVLAATKAGMTYVPMDPDDPPAHLADLARRSRLDLILSPTGRAPSWAPEIPRAVIDDLSANREPVALHPPPDPVPAYILFTSGSTGQPKGVLVDQTSVDNLVTAGQRLFDFSPEDVVVLAHSFSFDFSVWEIWSALCFGGTLVIATREHLLDSRAFARLMVEHGVTVLNQTPTSFFRSWPHIDRPESVLRLVIFGGELLDPRQLRRVLGRRLPERPDFVNMYGITEATVHSTVQYISPRLLEGDESLIGRPIPGVSITLRDEDGEEVPEGVSGEICVGGAGVALGYLDQADLTAERFVAVHGRRARELRTGDLGRLDSQGRVEFLGRSDRQLSVRGYRIEPAQIENRLRDISGIDNAVVDSDGESLIAYVVLAEEADLSAAVIRAVLAAELPNHLVPTDLRRVHEIPVDRNGKTSLRELRELRYVRLQVIDAGSPDVVTTEATVSAAWEDVLGYRVQDHHMSFFDAGGHSLLVVDLQALLEERGLAVSVLDLFTYPSIRACCDFLDRRHSREIAPAEDDESNRARRRMRRRRETDGKND